MKIDVCPVDDLQMSQGFAEALRLAKSARALRFFFFFLEGGGGGYLSMPSLHDYDVKRHNFMFCGGCGQKPTNSVDWFDAS